MIVGCYRAVRLLAPESHLLKVYRKFEHMKKERDKDNKKKGTSVIFNIVRPFSQNISQNSCPTLIVVTKYIWGKLYNAPTSSILFATAPYIFLFVKYPLITIFPARKTGQVKGTRGELKKRKEEKVSW
jgi:hypothetical protein